MAKVLVTGASGFIGAHLVSALVRGGDQVRCLVRKTSNVQALRGQDVEFFQGDLEEGRSLDKAVAGTDVVYHLAGLTHALQASRLYAVNGGGTARVAAACARQTTPPVHVLVSSIASAGPTKSGRLRLESDRPRPVSHYGRSKRVGEQVVATHAAHVPTTIVRPGIVFGERDKECLRIFQTIERFRVHPVPGFRTLPLSVIHVHDLVEILLRAAQSGTRLPADANSSPVGIGCYFACRDEYPDYVELGRCVARALDRSVIIFPIAMPFPWMLAGANELIARFRGQSDAFNIDKMREATSGSWACSAATTQRELGFVSQATLDEQLRTTVSWYREQGWLPPYDRGWHTIPALNRRSSSVQARSTTS